jgi:serine/threonine-protein kinase
MDETAPVSPVGSRVGPYLLRRLLGRGGMGEVYEAYDTVKDRVIALKLMSQAVSQDPVFRERMQREAHTAGRLQEPHIVPIHDYGEIDGQLFIDMRFIEGVDVAALLDRDGPLPPPRAVAIVRQVAAALDAAHGAGVIHRDIKPENILVTGDDFAYLVDFGIAAGFADERLTRTGAMVGTFNYMAPERFGTAEVTYRADIYALACVLFECVVGVAPYRADSLSVLVGAHLHQPIPRPSLLRPGIPAAFDEVIARGMAKQPADRYSRAGDLARAALQALSSSDQGQALSLLRNSQQSAPMRPPPPAWTPPPAPPPRGRTPWLIPAAAAVVLVVADLAGLGIWQATRPDRRGGTTGGQRPSASAAPTPHAASSTVPVAGLDSILLGSADINNVMGNSILEVAATTKQLDDTPYKLSNPDCLGALFSLMEPSYAGSGYTAVAAEFLQEPGGGAQLIDQGVVAFPSADRAAAFVSSAAPKWKACAGRTVVQTQDGGPTLAWLLGQVVGDPPAIAQLDAPKDHVPCQHALRAVSNVVLDVGVCGPQVSNQAERIANAMAAKVTR